MRRHVVLTLGKQITTLLLIGAFLIPAVGVVAPRTAHASGAPVLDALNLVENTFSAVLNAADKTKEYVLDTLSWQVANLAIQSMTKSLVNWINSGFQGSPAFVTDLGQNLRGVEDAVARRFFAELSNQRITDENAPFQDKVLDAVRLGYYLRTSPESFYTRNPYTLNQVSANDRAFLDGDFSQGGWNAWFATVMNPNNNIYGAQMIANQALEDSVAAASGKRLQELSWNRGFLSWRGECIKNRDGTAAFNEYDENGNLVPQGVDLSGEDLCSEYEIRTPGAVIMEQLNTQLGSGVNRLISADEFNEVIGALLNQLALKVLGEGDGGGLSGVSRPSSGGGSSYLDRATAPDQAGAGSGAALAGNFSASVSEQRQTIETYSNNWQKVQNAAQEAERRCGTRSDTQVQFALDHSTRGLVKAADALSALDSIQSRIATANTTGGNQTQTFATIASEYTELTRSSRLPTAQEIAEAQIEAADTGDAEPGSLYSQMVRISSSRFCNR